jgi:hypothetical protein
MEVANVDEGGRRADDGFDVRRGRTARLRADRDRLAQE